MIRIKRGYEAPADDDGFRVLIDRLWPRGLAKEAAHIDLWQKDIAPSDALRKWFGHDPAKWTEFQSRYRNELEEHAETLAELRAQSRHGPMTLLYAAKDEAHNNAVVLQALLSRRKAAAEH
jgi:uncharacterized protein YeaO (DUF488 family)